MSLVIREGADSAGSPADVAAKTDVVITMVIDTSAVEEVTLGPRGIIEGLKPGNDRRRSQHHRSRWCAPVGVDAQGLAAST